jgi:hypothetical protein
MENRPMDQQIEAIRPLQSALKGKAPIAAIPIEGKAPVCIDAKCLRAWSKGVTLDTVTVEVTGGDWYPSEKRAPHGGEGPADLIAERTVETRSLRITGHVGRIKTRCTMFAIDRRTAVKVLSKWSEKERERIQKRILKGALDATMRKELKRAQFEETPNTETVLTHYALPGKEKDKQVIEVRRGIPVSIPEAGTMELVLVRRADSQGDSISWSVTERRSGMQAGSGDNAEDALIDARANFRKAKPERLAALIAQTAAAYLPVETSIAA